jgi:hypothetical protein
MEEVINFFSSINKISLLSFFVTLILLGYQIYLFKKEITRKKNKINLPDFKDNFYFEKEKKQIFLIEKKDEKKISSFSFFFGNKFIVFILFLIYFFIFIFTMTKNKTPNELPVNSSLTNEERKIILTGKIKIYNEKWQELNDEELKNLKPGEKIFIGIEKVGFSDIDMARIKVNQGAWDEESITQNFNPEKNVFYKEYQVATADSFLKIEAQLHSSTEGWLGE